MGGGLIPAPHFVLRGQRGTTMNIQPGDVVEALHDMWGPLPPDTPDINKGFRTFVVGITLPGCCLHCNRTGPGLELAGLPLAADRAWCVNHWRKIGGSLEDTSQLFAEDLKIASVVQSRIRDLTNLLFRATR